MKSKLFYYWSFTKYIFQLLKYKYYLYSQKFYGKFNKTEAEKIRLQFNALEEEVRQIKKKIEESEQVLKIDFGPENVFYTLKGNCFSITHKEYDYVLCPFDKATQKDKRHSNVSLGKWDSFNDKYTTWSFKNGQGCWNGPLRSLSVNLICGSSDVVKKVDETSLCVYEMDFETPAVCSNEELVTLQERLKSMIE